MSERIKNINGVIILSHSMDADGICSAAILKAVIKSAEVTLIDYNQILNALKNVIPPVTEIYIADLTIAEAIKDHVLSEIKRISTFSKVYFFDHHPLSNDILATLNQFCTVRYSTDESASILVYEYFKNRLPRIFCKVAAYGAIMDYLDEGPKAKVYIYSWNRPTILYEATSMGLALAQKGDDLGWKLQLVNVLSENVEHGLQLCESIAIKQRQSEWNLIRELEQKHKIRGKIAIVETKQPAIGVVASYLIGVAGAEIGLAYRISDKLVKVSLRRRIESSVNLGEIAKKAAKVVGGKGGGHPEAAGANIPAEEVNNFVEAVMSLLIL